MWTLSPPVIDQDNVLAPAIGVRRGTTGAADGGLAPVARMEATLEGLGAGHDHRVDHVNDAIAAGDVRRGHFRTAHHHPVSAIDPQILPLNRLRRQLLASHVRCHDGTSRDVELENVRELRLVLRLHEVLHRACWQLRKSSIGGCKDRERALALQGVCEACGRHSGNEGLERTRCDGCVDDVVGLIGHGDFLIIIMQHQIFLMHCKMLMVFVRS